MYLIQWFAKTGRETWVNTRPHTPFLQSLSPIYWQFNPYSNNWQRCQYYRHPTGSYCLMAAWGFSTVPQRSVTHAVTHTSRWWRKLGRQSCPVVFSETLYVSSGSLSGVEILPMVIHTGRAVFLTKCALCGECLFNGFPMTSNIAVSWHSSCQQLIEN